MPLFAEIIKLVLTSWSAALLILSSFLLCEVAAAALIPPVRVPRRHPRPRLAVVVPAHDEQYTIARTLCAIVPQLVTGDRLLVVADNCSDRTAEIAAECGAEVIKRTDSTRRGKGYALDAAIRTLETDPPALVIIVDADCDVAPDAVDLLSQECARVSAPIQARYLMRAPPDSDLKLQLAEFAWAVRNYVRPVGLHRLGLPCQLMGSGMAFPWHRIASARLATGHLVEDLKLGLELARVRAAPRFCPQAVVTSTFPRTSSDARQQRTRWEHGHLGLFFKEAPRGLWHAISRGNRDLAVLVADLSVPPLTLLALQVTGLMLLSGASWSFLGIWVPFALASIACTFLVLSLYLSSLHIGSGRIPARALIAAVPYALWKIPVYITFLFARQLEWIRSKRDDGEP